MPLLTRLNLAAATSPDLAEALIALDKEGWSETGAKTRWMTGGYFRALYHNYANAYYQYLNGTLDEDQWLPHLREIVFIVEDVDHQAFWSEWKIVYDDPFRELVDELIEGPTQAVLPK